MWYIHAIKYYSGITKKEILLLVTTLIILEDIMISGKERHRKTNTIWSHLHVESEQQINFDIVCIYIYIARVVWQWVKVLKMYRFQVVE